MIDFTVTSRRLLHQEGEEQPITPLRRGRVAEALDVADELREALSGGVA